MILLGLKHSVLAPVTSWSSLTRNPCTAITILKLTLFLCFFEDAPSLDVYPTSSVVVEGQNFTLSCNASGKPSPRLTWTKVGGLGQVLSQTSTLIVNNASRTVNANNMIQYQCTADNGVGHAATAVANVTVHCKYLIVSDKTYYHDNSYSSKTWVLCHSKSTQHSHKCTDRLQALQQLLGRCWSDLFFQIHDKLNVYVCRRDWL